MPHGHFGLRQPGAPASAAASGRTGRACLMCVAASAYIEKRNIQVISGGKSACTARGDDCCGAGWTATKQLLQKRAIGRCLKRSEIPPRSAHRMRAGRENFVNRMKDKDFPSKNSFFSALKERKRPPKISLRRNNTVPKTSTGPIGKHRSRAIRVAEWRLSSSQAPYRRGPARI